MSVRFRNLSIGTKLMSRQQCLFSFYEYFTYFVTTYTSSIIERNALAELKNQAEW